VRGNRQWATTTALQQKSPWYSTQVVVVADGILSELDLLMDKVALYEW
jgi:hypothetical protein